VLEQKQPSFVKQLTNEMSAELCTFITSILQCRVGVHKQPIKL